MAQRILFADTGTTFTKVSLLEWENNAWRILERASVPTTVDSPNFDVMVGLQSAIEKLESWTGIKLLSQGRLVSTETENGGIGQFTATSSAGGGLQVLVAGLTEHITAESGHRAALGAGAVVTEVVSLSQTSTDLKSLERIRNVPCDVILITGGTDGGNISDVLALAEFLSLAAPKPRFGDGKKTPLIYAGNVDARSHLEKIVKDTMDLVCIDNIRPTIETEYLLPVREAIQKIFLEHVMSGAPGFKSLADWTQNRVKPTPVALGTALTHLASQYDHNVLAADIGGATTDIFSVINGRFYRSVSADAGMSTGIANMMEETDPETIKRWLPWAVDDNFVGNWHLNKIVRPTTLPQTPQELILEQSFAKQAVNLALNHHRSVATGLRGVKISREIGDIFTQYSSGQTLVNLMSTGTIVGLGGVIANAPRYTQALSVILDGIQPEGVTNILVDTGTFLPFAGFLSANNDNLNAPPLNFQPPIFVATCIAPVGPPVKPGTKMATLNYGTDSYKIISGEISVIPLQDRANHEILVTPEKDFDIGKGKGNPTRVAVGRSEVGLVLDGRGRPLVLPQNPKQRISAIRQWYEKLNAYPNTALHMERGDIHGGIL